MDSFHLSLALRFLETWPHSGQQQYRLFSLKHSRTRLGLHSNSTNSTSPFLTVWCWPDLSLCIKNSILKWNHPYAQINPMILITTTWVYTPQTGKLVIQMYPFWHLAALSIHWRLFKWTKPSTRQGGKALNSIYPSEMKVHARWLRLLLYFPRLQLTFNFLGSINFFRLGNSPTHSWISLPTITSLYD